MQAFKKLGHSQLSSKYNIELIDLNKSERILIKDINAHILKEAILPKIAFESYIINLPVLKIHSEARMTASLKNVFGFFLNSEWLYQDKNSEIYLPKSEVNGWWNKSDLHNSNLDQAIIDLNSYIRFNFSIVDASIGQLVSEVHGIPCSPPLGKIIAGYNPIEVDKECATLLNIKPSQIPYLIS